MPNPPPTLSSDRPERAWRAVHEDPARPWPRCSPVTEVAGAERVYAWSVPGLAIGAPVVIRGRSVGDVVRQVIGIGRAGGEIRSSRRVLALVLHELEPGAEVEGVAGAWPARGVARRIAVTVTLAWAGPVVTVVDDPVAGSA